MEDYSVLMSVYRGENPSHFRASIQSMLDQTVPTNDFVLVCDGPLTDELDETIDEFVTKRPFLFQIIRLQENQGLGNALNVGIRYCKNNLIARMDADDISLPDRCERELFEFNQNDKLDIVSGTILEFSSDPKQITVAKYLPETDVEIRSYAKRRCPFNHPCVMYRKEAVLKAGGYEDCSLFEDYHLWVRMLLSGSIGFNIQSPPLLLMRANGDMYQRRGGVSYAIKALSFRTFMLRSGFCSKEDYLYTLFAHIVVSVMPNKIRKFIYKRYLRSSYDGVITRKIAQEEYNNG